MIRHATIDDIPRIVELGSRSLVDGPYAGMIADNPEQTAALARAVIEEKGRVLLWEEPEGCVTGLLAFVVFDHYFSGEKTAGEVIWYVIPEARQGGAALKLMWAAEQQAREMGARKMQFTAPTEGVGAIYKRFGYQQVEVMYQKEITCQSQPAQL